MSRDFGCAILPFKGLDGRDVKGPHKMIMLLSVISLFENGHCKDEQINIKRDIDSLFSIFNIKWIDNRSIQKYKYEAKSSDSEKRFGDPFFHLQKVEIRSGAFWKIEPNFNEKINAPITKIAKLKDKIRCVSLDRNFVKYIANTTDRDEIKQYLEEKIEDYLGKGVTQLAKNDFGAMIKFWEELRNNLQRKGLNKDVVSLQEAREKEMQKSHANMFGGFYNEITIENDEVRFDFYVVNKQMRDSHPNSTVQLPFIHTNQHIKDIFSGLISAPIFNPWNPNNPGENRGEPLIIVKNKISISDIKQSVDFVTDIITRFLNVKNAIIKE